MMLLPIRLNGVLCCNMRTIDIGILLSPQINFDFIGGFLSGNELLCGAHVVTACGDKILWNGLLYNELHFCPSADDACFALHDVVIGVNFHWQRCETQMFCGELIFFIEDGKVRAVNRLPVEDYLQSVISSEMSATSSLEFLKAHTVISRSWLYAQLQRKKLSACSALGYENEKETVRWYAREDHTLFDLCADDHCQRYQGITRAINPNVRRAVEQTGNMVLCYDGRVCDARFSKCCGGVTERFSACWEDVDYPYLQVFRDMDSKYDFPDLTDENEARRWIEASPDSYCSTDDKEVLSQILNGYDCETNDFYRWRVCYTQSELSKLVYSRSGFDFGDITDLQPVERAASGRLVRLRIVGSKMSRIVGKELEIRRWLSTSHLYSSAFVVDKVYDDADELIFVIKGAGWGHGVGLCQIGAAMMGEKGFGYVDILKHYYPGASLVNVDNL